MSFDGIPVALANGVGVVGVVLIIGWLIWSGRLIPKSTYDAHIALLNQQLEDERHESGEWRTEARLKDQAVSELNDQNRIMLRGFETLAEFLHSLRRAGVGNMDEKDGTR